MSHLLCVVIVVAFAVVVGVSVSLLWTSCGCPMLSPKTRMAMVIQKLHKIAAYIVYNNTVYVYIYVYIYIYTYMYDQYDLLIL